jgi:hypothetical protein
MAVLGMAGAAGFLPQQGDAPSGDRQTGGEHSGGAGRRGTLLARGADGAVYRRVTGKDQVLRREQGWTLAAPPVEGPVTAVAAAGRAALFARGAEGAVLHAAPGAKGPGQWRNLGGRFAAPPVALALGDAIVLLARDETGRAFQLALPAQGGRPDSDWRAIGDGVAGELTVVPLGRDGFAVFALGRRGEVLHQVHKSARARASGWQTVTGASGTMLGVGLAGDRAGDRAGDKAGDQGIALALVDAEQRLRTLLWRGYPEKKPTPWKTEGDLQSWLVRPLAQPNRKPVGKKPRKQAESRKRARTRR